MILAGKLKDFLLDYTLQINKDQVLISEINGIGEIYSITEDLRNSILIYIKENIKEYNAFILDIDYSSDPKIYFYDNKYKNELDLISDCFDKRDKHLELEKEEIKKYFLNKYDSEKILKNYNIVLFNEHLNPKNRDSVTLYELYTTGSVISKNRKIEIKKYENDLNETELNFIKKELKRIEEEKIKYKEIEKELFFWYYTNNSNYTSLLFNLIGKADPTNLNKLKSVYPLHVEIFERFRNENGYFQKLENRFNQDI